MNMDAERPLRAATTLSGKVVGILVSFLALALAVIGLTLLQSWKLEGGAAAINDMGSERMRTYRIVYLLSEYARGARDEATRQEVRATLSAFESTLAAVQRGDPARPLFLPRAAAIAQQVEAVDARWHARVRPEVEAVLAGTDDTAAGLARVRGEVDAFVGTIDALVRAIEVDNAEATSLLRSLQLVLMALAVAGTVAIIYLMFLVVIRPVSLLCDNIRRLESEDFSARVPVEGRDEFGMLARAFNAMAAHLQNLYATLEARVNDKTRRLEQKNRELGTLYAVTAALNDAAGIEDLCRAFLRPVIETLGAAGGAVRLRQAAGKGVHMYVAEGLPETFVRGETCEHADHCLCGRAADAEKALLSVGPASHRRCTRAGYPTVAAIPIRYDGHLIGVFNLYFDTTVELEERTLQMLEVLGQHLGVALETARLQSSARELAVSEERNMIARELHDSIAQSLAFLNLQAQMLDGALQRGDVTEARDEVRQIRAGVQESYDDVRELLVHFRARVRDAGLTEAMRQALSRFEAQTGIRTVFQESGAGIDPGPETQLQILHVIQEALSNIRKHARAKRVTLILERGPVSRYRVRDDGAGFTPEAADEGGVHVGLQIMRERAERIGATVAVRSVPGQGTEVVLEVPLAQRQAA